MVWTLALVVCDTRNVTHVPRNPPTRARPFTQSDLATSARLACPQQFGATTSIVCSLGRALQDYYCQLQPQAGRPSTSPCGYSVQALQSERNCFQSAKCQNTLHDCRLLTQCTKVCPNYELTLLKPRKEKECNYSQGVEHSSVVECLLMVRRITGSILPDGPTELFFVPVSVQQLM